MRHGWQCDSCSKVSTEQPWNCPTCNVETCEYCFDSYAHCKKCVAVTSKIDMIRRAIAWGFDFDEEI